MRWDECCDECLNDCTCDYQDEDKVEDCYKYLDWYQKYEEDNIEIGDW